MTESVCPASALHHRLTRSHPTDAPYYPGSQTPLADHPGHEGHTLDYIRMPRHRVGPIIFPAVAGVGGYLTALRNGYQAHGDGWQPL